MQSSCKVYSVVNITLYIVFVGYYLNVYIQSSDPRLPLQDGHDEASGSSSEVDDTTETKVLVISSRDRTPVHESIVSKNELLLHDRGIGLLCELSGIKHFQFLSEHGQ